jgi:hypothetical protein
VPRIRRSLLHEKRIERCGIRRIGQADAVLVAQQDEGAIDLRTLHAVVGADEHVHDQRQAVFVGVERRQVRRDCSVRSSADTSAAKVGCSSFIHAVSDEVILSPRRPTYPSMPLFSTVRRARY